MSFFPKDFDLDLGMLNFHVNKLGNDTTRLVRYFWIRMNSNQYQWCIILYPHFTEFYFLQIPQQLVSSFVSASVYTHAHSGLWLDCQQLSRCTGRAAGRSSLCIFSGWKSIGNHIPVILRHCPEYRGVHMERERESVCVCVWAHGER